MSKKIRSSFSLLAASAVLGIDLVNVIDDSIKGVILADNTPKGKCPNGCGKDRAFNKSYCSAECCREHKSKMRGKP